MNDKDFEHRRYNNGDQIWIRRSTNKVVKLITHDNLSWEDDTENVTFKKENE